MTTRLTKLSPKTRRLSLTSGADAPVTVLAEWHGPADRALAEADCARFDAEILSWLATGRLVRLRLPAGRLADLAGLRHIGAIETDQTFSQDD